MRLRRPGRAGSRHASPAAPTRPASGYPADPARLDHAPVRPAAVAGLMLGLAGLVLLQVTLVAFLPTPVTAPDLVVVAVLALAIARGPVVGGLAGAWSGLLLDLVPPAAGVLGGWMLVLGLAGYVLGRVAATFRPGPLAALAFPTPGSTGSGSRGLSQPAARGGHPRPGHHGTGATPGQARRPLLRSPWRLSKPFFYPRPEYALWL